MAYTLLIYVYCSVSKLYDLYAQGLDLTNYGTNFGLHCELQRNRMLTVEKVGIAQSITISGRKRCTINISGTGIANNLTQKSGESDIKEFIRCYRSRRFWTGSDPNKKKPDSTPKKCRSRSGPKKIPDLDHTKSCGSDRTRIRNTAIDKP
jgi:hypothetical protein